MKKDQYTDWTLDDIDPQAIKRGEFVPNWVKAGYNSRSDAIEGVMKFIKDRQALFDALGLVGGVIKRKKKKNEKKDD